MRMALALVLSILLSTPSFAMSADDGIKKVYARNSLQKEARRLVERGLYDEAIEKYREASKPEYISLEYQKGFPIGAMVDVLKFQRRYEDAAREYEWFFRVENNSIVANEQRRELAALVEFSRTGNPAPVYNHINQIYIDQAAYLPPNDYSQMAPMYISDLLQIYDVLGDYSAGIDLIDKTLAFFRTGKTGNAEPNWVDAEYIKIREAFEKDKAAGTKGSATKAIIQSDYFPW